MNSSLQAPADPWRALTRDSGDAAMHAAWLACLVRGLRDVAEAHLVLGAANVGPFRPVAAWPDGAHGDAELAGLCEQVIEMRLPLTLSGPHGSTRRSVLAMPVLRDADVLGVVAVGFAGPIPPQAADWLRWGLGWLVARASASGQEGESALRERMLVALDLMMSALGETSAPSAANAVVTDAAVRLGCDRVSIGFARHGSVKLLALSHSADFSRRIDLTHAIEAAMDEAADQGASLAVGADPGGELDTNQAEAQTYLITREHERLLRDFGAGAVLSVPFGLDANHVERDHGVFVFEWPDGTVDPVMRQIALGLPPLLGRVLIEKRANDRPLWRRCGDALRLQSHRLFGPLHTGRKVVASLLLLAIVFFAFATGTFRVPAKAALEGGVRRVIATPFDGFVATAEARAGNVVHAGDVLATLDDRDLRLEASRWSSQQRQYADQANDAEAQHNLAQMQIAQAQRQQAAAQRELSESLLERSRVVAPFDGVIVAGDLSQHLGGAVKKGQTLFEIAPLDSYRIVLDVDESDIAHVQSGQKGELVVTALPGEKFPFGVTLVTPVAHQADGKNLFRVEATLERPDTRLRPGMEGVAKVDIGTARLIWIGTHRMGDWLRLQAWNWLGL